jgi:hypothetical protein
MFDKKNYQGVVDLGTPEQKAKLFEMRELVYAPAGVSMAQTDPSRWKIWPRRSQGDQSSCVYHARAKASGILHEMTTGEFVEHSACDYEKRSNKPAEGSFPVESFDMWRDQGVGLEALEQSNNITAKALRGHNQTKFEKNVATISKLGAYYALQAYDFDAIVSTLHATRKPIPVGFFATWAEWNRDTPIIQDANLQLTSAPVRHEVCATPNFGIWNNQEGFTIEDSLGSVGIGGTGVRFITRDFFSRRNYIAGLVPTSFKDYEYVNPAKPRIKLTRDLEKGMVGMDVYQLQQVYKYEGFFPANHSGSQFFLEITERCTKQYQAKYGIVDEGTPSTTGYGRVGRVTRENINTNYK